MTLKELQAERAATLQKAKAMNDAAKAENRDLTDDEKVSMDDLLAKADGLKVGITASEADASRASRLELGIADLNTSRGRRTTPDEPDNGLAVNDLSSVSAGEDLRATDPNFGFVNYGDFVGAVRNAGNPGFSGPLDDRLAFMSAALGQNVAAGDDGGFLVPPAQSNVVFERALEILPIIGQTDRIVLSGPGNSMTIISTVDHDRSGTTFRYAGVIPYWTDEAEQITRSNLKFRKTQLIANKLAALSYATDESMSDAVVNFGERLLTKHATAIADELVEAVMFGNGVGRPLGAFISDAAVTLTRGTTTAIKFEDVINMEERLYGPSDGRAQYYFNGNSCWRQVRTLKLSGGTGNDPAAIIDTGARTLDGRAYNKTEHCEALGTKGDIALADFSQYVLLTKGNVDTAMSIHLRFDFGETAFRSTFRVDGKPHWERPLTPRKGLNQVSPFVLLSTK